MARQPNILRPIRLNTTFPEDIRAKLEIHLYSPLEGRVPKSAMQKFLLERIREYFEEKRCYLTNSECSLVRRALASAIENWSQEEWPDEADYSLAHLLLEKLK